MPIERQVNLWGKIIQKRTVIPGYQEDLIKRDSIRESDPSRTKLVYVTVVDWDTLEFFQGRYTGFGRKVDRDLWQLGTEGTTVRLNKGKINMAQVEGNRNWRGIKIQFRWKPTPDDLDLFIEAAAGHRPIFSEAPL